jgi:hypothetical protein
MKKALYLTAAAVFMAPALCAHANETSAPTGNDLISASVGYFNVLDSHDEAVDFRVEYRSGYDLWNGIKPWAGIEITSDASLWIGGGALYNWEFTPQWNLTPSFGAGYYAPGSSDLDLGSPLEFRSQLELGYEFDTGNQVAVAFSHTSNASINDDNPGTEVLSLYWHKPF